MAKLEQRKICVINGDDFGASTGINRAIIEAHTHGILTSASVMINMPAADEAILLSAKYPDLSIGLHVNFTNENDPVIDVNDIDAARTELHRQYQLFVDCKGEPPTHIDSHHNVHRMARLSPLFLELAGENDLLLREHSPVRYFSSFYGRWDGESHPEHISPQQLVHMLEHEIRPGLTELACHPGYMTDDFRSEYASEREVELKSLCDPLVRQRIVELDIQLVSYSQVRDFLNSMEEGSE
jgi:predicted glycoside hydrolase/deacetylase ChbG (UPF0249 family)